MRKTFMTIAIFAALLTTVGQTEEPKREAPPSGNIEHLSEQNSDFRRTLFTGKNVQVVLMSLRPKEEIGEEVHKVDQCFFFERGTGQSVVSGKVEPFKAHDYLCVPAGIRHNIRNTVQESLKLFTIYAPPQHPAGTVHHTKEEAAKAEEPTPQL